MQQIHAFQSRGDPSSTTSIAVTAAAQNLTLPAVPLEGGTLRLVNSGTQTVFVAFAGTATVAGSMPMLPNTVETFTIGFTATLSVIASATGSTLFATVGDGK